MKNTRRDFLKQATMLGAGAGLLHAFPPAIQKAFSIQPAPGSTFLDAEHVVFLMQENRSFDHMYGALRGVRGFNDPRAVRLNNGNPVWLQSDQGKTYAPFRLNLRDTKATWMSSLPHGWTDQVDAGNGGEHDGWLKAKRSPNEKYAAMPLTLGYYNRQDLPFYYALADAFTVCDQHFCSSLTGTTPNRLYFWSGMIKDPNDPTGQARVWNGDGDYDTPVGWKSLPERMEDAGISWKVYQNEISVGVGLSGEEDAWLGNFTDNTLEFFSAYNVKLAPAYIANLPREEKRLLAAIQSLEEKLSAATPEKISSLQEELDNTRKQLEANRKDQQVYTLEKFNSLPERERRLHEKAFVVNSGDPSYHQLTAVSYKDKGITRRLNIPAGDVLYQFRKDVDSGNLPAVSWLVAPENFSDHPGAPWYGAWYLSEVFNILTKNPEVWKKTIFILTYDENDGYFDHVPPFLPPSGDGYGKMSKGLDASSELVSKTQQSWGNEYVRESPTGLGFRVPMVVASPWSRGGFVNSEVFDHTSCLQFLEKFLQHKTGKEIIESNISSWRRTITGDLSSVFREANDKDVMPPAVERKKFISEIHSAQYKRLPSGFKALSEAEITRVRNGGRINALPKQERGTRPACALPYELLADMHVGEDRSLRVIMKSGKQAGAPFMIRCNGLIHGQRIRYYAAKAVDAVEDIFNAEDFRDGRVWIELYGPNGFYRMYKGVGGSYPLQVYCTTPVASTDAASTSFALDFNNAAPGKQIKLTDKSYGLLPKPVVMTFGDLVANKFRQQLDKTFGWYDFELSFAGDVYRYAGHVENGRVSRSDPGMGK